MKKKIFLATMLIAVMYVEQACVSNSFPEPVNCDINPIVLQLISFEDTDCALQEGRFEVAATGGTGVYRYKLDNGAYQSDALFLNLAAGTYTVFATDATKCTTMLDVVIRNKNGVNIDLTTNDAGCMEANGGITAIAIGGTGPYLYKINAEQFQSNSMFTNLSMGEYSIIVKDATGCEVGQSVKIKSGVSFSGTISPIIQNNCAVSGCHNGSQFPDFRIFKNIQDNAARIKAQTGSRNMPLEGSLTQLQIDNIACWVDDGTPEN